MQQKTINSEILRIAIPAIVSNITTPLLGLVDTAITGHLGAAVYLSAIAVGGTMFSMLYWLMAFLRMGTSGLTAQAYGAKHTDTAHAILRQGCLIALVVSVGMIILSPWLSDLLLSVMDADADTSALAHRYFMIVIWGAPAVLGTYTLSGWFLGMQDSRSPMWMALVTNVVNIIASLVLVYGLNLKIEGVASGTVIAQWMGLSVGAGIYCHRYGMAMLKDGSISLRRFFGVNTDIFLRTLCLVAVTVWFTRTGASMGTGILAANALLMQLFILFSYFMDGFAFAGEALAGKYYGAHDIGNLRKTVAGVFLWGAAIVVLFTIVYLAGGELILRMLTDDFDVLASAMTYLPWAVAVPVAGVAAFAWDGIFIGMTMTRQMLISMVIAMAVFFVCLALFRPALANHGLWLAFVTYLLTRGIVQSIIFYRRLHHLFLSSQEIK